MAATRHSAIRVVTGSDDGAVAKTAAGLAAEMAPGGDPFGLEVIDGGAETVDVALRRLRQAASAVSTLPFPGCGRLVWLKGVTFLSDTVVGRSEAVVEGVAGLCDVLERGLPEGVGLLVSAPQPDKRRAGYKRLVKLAEVVVCDKPDLGFRAGEGDLVAWTARVVRESGLAMEPAAVEVLASRVGLDAGLLGNELVKLDVAHGREHRITAAEVRELVPATRESGIFDVGNAVAARDLPLALATLGQLFQQGERGVGILLASIVPTVRSLMLAKDLITRHRLGVPREANDFTRALKRLSSEETAHLPRKKDGTLNTWTLGLAAVQCGRYSMEELVAGFHACAEANHDLVGGRGDERGVLTRLLAGLIGRG
jgi:DNA polymerase III subunit delta